MSYILDALRKVERQRQLGAVPGVATMHASPRPRWRLWVLTAAAIVLANAAVWLLVGGPRPAGPPASAVPEPGAVSGPAAPPAPVRQAEPPPREPVAAARAATPGEAAPAAPPVDEGRRPAPRAPQPAASAAVERGGPPPPQPPVVSPPRPVGELPPAFREAVARLRLEVLVSSERPAERQVFINGRKYVQGETIEGTIVVEEILEEGVVLAWQGHRHLLRHFR